MLDEPKLSRTLAHLGHLLVRGEFAAVENLTRGNRLTAAELRAVIADYGRTLVDPPGGGFVPRSVVEITAALPERWNVYVDLWTAEEGRSDLTLELTVIDSPQELYDAVIEDLHVL